VIIGIAGLLLMLGAQSVPASDYYKVQVTRKAQDLYEVVGQNIYVKTRYCYEYAMYEDAIIEIDSPYGFSVGKIIFVGSSSQQCDIEKLLQ
jgi:hypothetical protein